MNKKNIVQRYAWILLTGLLGACAARPGGSESTRSTPTSVSTSVPLAPMPEAVTSFGAVTHDGWLYTYGGHRGERHEYSADHVSGSFHRLRLDGTSPWEPLPPGPESQGLPLVTDGRHVYRVGGMAARNRPGEKQDLFSRTDAARFDPAQRRWESLPPLPEPRSSHDALVLENRLYVGGGWSLQGGTNAPVWPDHGWVLDLRNPRKGWTRFPHPFRRRALSMAAIGSRIHFIGGMDSDGKPTSAVEILDTRTGSWSKGPDLPEGRFKGFTCSAVSFDGRIYANGFQGDLLRLSHDGSAWEIIGRARNPRLAHRLVPAGTRHLIVLGGEDGEDKRPDLEVHALRNTTPVASRP